MLIHTIRLSSITKISQPLALAIGNFDGVHTGHQHLLQLTKDYATTHRCHSAVLTFEPYPQSLFNPQQTIIRLTSLREKAYLLQQSGIDVLACLPFTAKLAQYSAQQFIDEILCGLLKARAIIIGEDFRFGRERQGDVALLEKDARFTVIRAVTQCAAGQKIGSTRIREALLTGDLAQAEKCLGHPYFMIGRVKHGDKRGRELGFPTANLHLPHRQPPVRGVFAVRVYGVENKVLTGVANVGIRPTVDGQRNILEVYIFDFAGDLYGKYLRVEFVQKIRDEQRFSSLDALRAQIAQDVIAAREILGTK